MKMHSIFAHPAIHADLGPSTALPVLFGFAMSKPVGQHIWIERQLLKKSAKRSIFVHLIRISTLKQLEILYWHDHKFTSRITSHELELIFAPVTHHVGSGTRVWGQKSD
jgi:hypothetical protein